VALSFARKKKIVVCFVHMEISIAFQSKKKRFKIKLIKQIQKDKYL